MHEFTDLADRSTSYVLGVLNETADRIGAQLETSSATHHIKNLQMIQMHKAIMAVGLFSLFEAVLQDGLEVEHGFREADAVLAALGDADLALRFRQYRLAVNVLKHGRGKSYDALAAKISDLPFRMKGPDEAFFEGDVSEVSTLIEVDDAFVSACADLVREVSAVLRAARPEAVF